MSIESKIQAAASHNVALLGVLSETDYAPPALQQHNRYINDLETEAKNMDAQIRTLEMNRDKEFKEHERYRDSVMKRFAYKIGRKTEKFEAKASKEEREYFDALHEEHKTKEMRKDLDQRLNEAIAAKPSLHSIAARHAQAQADLDALYDSIFEGPTPGFPEEDERERAAHVSLQRYEELRSRAEAEKQAVQILAIAQKKMVLATRTLNDAKDWSTLDCWGGGMMTDMMERNALSQAEVRISEVLIQIAQAQRMSSAVESLPPVNIAKGNVMGDIIFDNIFSDLAFHDKIKQSVAELKRAALVLDQQENLAKNRHAGLLQELIPVAQALEESRVALQKARESAFRQVAGLTF